MSASDDDDEHASHDASALAAGRELLGKFRLGAVQRETACSELREATHLIFGRPVLVWLRRDLQPGSEAAARFVAAMESLARSREKTLLDVYEPFELDAGVGAVTEVTSRPTLADELDARPGVAWSPSAVRSWIVPMLRALHAVHERGIVHGRLSPSSVTRTREHVRLVDLVDLRLVAPSLTAFSPPPADDLRRLAPEWIAEPDEVGPTADIYSVGCLLFRLTTGREPFPDDDPHALMTAHLSQAPADGVRLVADLDEGMSRIIQRALSKHPDYRFESAAEMAEAVDNFSAYLRPVPVRKPPWSGRFDLVAPAAEPQARAAPPVSLDVSPRVQPSAEQAHLLSEPLLDAADTTPDAHPDAPPLASGILDDEEDVDEIYEQLEIDGVDVDTPDDAVLVGSRVLTRARPAPTRPVARREPFDPLETQPGITPAALQPKRTVVPIPATTDEEDDDETTPQEVPARPRPVEAAPVAAPEADAAPERVPWRPPSVEALGERAPRRPRIPRGFRVRLVWLLAGAALMLGVLAVVWLATPRLGADATLEVRESPGQVRELLGGEVMVGQDMVIVPGGVALVGGGAGREPRLDARAVYVSPFAIDRLEVSVAEYEQCVASGLCQPRQGAPADAAEPGQWPVTRVTWRGADEFCRSRGKRLPTEAEWEKAARGTTGRSFPWGEFADCRRGLSGHGECGEAPVSPEPVGSRPAGVSPWGVEQMADNVWEWTADWYAEPDWHQANASSADPVGPPEGPGRVVKGGDFGSAARTAAARGWNPVDAVSDRGGFRCAVSLPGGELQGRIELFGAAPRLDRRLDNYLLGGEGGPLLARPRRP